MTTKSNIITVSVDGNIGAGKTTVIEQLKKINIQIITEPVDEWKELLTKLGEDPKKYVLQLQMKVLQHYIFVKKYIEKQQHTIESPTVIIVERSIESSLYIFAKTYMSLGHLSETNFEKLKELATKVTFDFDYRILIQTDPNVCFQRIQHRGRSCENSLTVTFLEKLKLYQTKMYEKYTSQQHFIINGNQDKQTVCECFDSILKKITS